MSAALTIIIVILVVKFFLTTKSEKNKEEVCNDNIYGNDIQDADFEELD